MTAAPIVLVPGFWLGAWAWDDVAAALRADGHKVTALTLPGLESVETDRSKIGVADHIAAICDAVRAATAPVVLAVHSGAGASGYFASDRVPELIAAMVYVDTGAAKGPLDPEFKGVEKPLPSPEELRANENLGGLTEEQLATFRRRAVPEPGAVLREAPALSNPARLELPSTVICTGYTSDEYKDAIRKGYDFVAGLADVRDVAFVDLPTSHWPMWSRPKELAAIIGGIAVAHGSGDRLGAAHLRR
jgi:pimeloyl-ACP methyl ester carboxylesterase